MEPLLAETKQNIGALNTENEIDRKNFFFIFLIYLSVFINSYVFFREPFEFYLGYIVYIFLLPVFVSRYGINRSLFFIFLILFVTGVFNIVMQNNTPSLFFKVYTGLALSYFFYYYVVVEFNYNVEKLFKWYLKGAYFVSLLGLAQFVFFQVGFEWGYRFGYVFNKWGISPGGTFGIRVNSVFAEPTHLAAVLSTAFFVAIYDLFRRKHLYLYRYQSLVIIAVYLLSFSGLAQAGIFLTVIFFAISFGLIRYFVVTIPVAIILFNVLYNNVTEFKERLDSIVSLWSGNKFELGKTHGSSFILYNNFIVATENFKTNFVFGTGIGSHPIAFEKHSIGKEIDTWGFNLNSADANSMFLRLVSETGLFGVLIFLIIIVKCYVVRGENPTSNHWLISNALLIMILLNLFRQGHYFLNGFPFFVIMYYFNKKNYEQHLEQENSGVPHPDENESVVST